MKIKLLILIILVLLFSEASLFAQSRGESLFKENNAKDAVQVLEYEIINGQISENSYNFLGLGYYQLGDYDKSLDAFKRGLKAQPENAKLLSYNMGNTYYAMKNYSAAATSYSDAIKADPLFYDALLNRANALLMEGQLLSSKDDYVDFITKCPDNPQRERIELLIKALEEEIARREEEARLLAEQNKAQWEEYDGNLNDKQKDEFIPDWELVETGIENTKKDSDNPEWEKILRENPEAIADTSRQDKLLSDNEKTDGQKIDWEEFEQGVNLELSKDEEIVNDQEDWFTFSDAELDEMKELEKESREEHEKWLENERLRAQEIANKEAQAKQKEQQLALEEERKLREQLLEDMRKSEDERRKKLLEDVANSLQGSDSTNLTSGAEDLIDYDLEGELD